MIHWNHFIVWPMLPDHWKPLKPKVEQPKDRCMSQTEPNNMLYRYLIDKTCLIDEISDLQCILKCSLEGWLMICRDQSLTMGGVKNVCQHWIFYWHWLVPFVRRQLGLFHRVLVAHSPLQLRGCHTLSRDWYYRERARSTSALLWQAAAAAAAAGYTLGECVHISFPSPGKPLSGLSCHRLDKDCSVGKQRFKEGFFLSHLGMLYTN